MRTTLERVASGSVRVESAHSFHSLSPPRYAAPEAHKERVGNVQVRVALEFCQNSHSPFDSSKLPDGVKMPALAHQRESGLAGECGDPEIVEG